MRRRWPSQYIPIGATVLVLIALYVGAGLSYDNFFSRAVVINLFRDNAILGVAAIGMTFVILSGGIDLSVGAMIGFTSILLATLIERYHWSPLLAIVSSVALGAVFGSGMGAVIHYFNLPPFLVTLAGMFLARGLGFVIQLESIGIQHPWYARMAEFQFPAEARYGLPGVALMYLGLLLLAIGVAHCTRFGRNVYAVGGSESSAVLMGLPVAATKIGVYAVSGFCSALAGVVYTFYTMSGNPTVGSGSELDAIAAVVIGGTLLSGGVGYQVGTLFGVLIFGVIQTAITFQGTLSSWWTRIAIGGLLLLFILLQRVIESRSLRRR